MVKLRTGTLRDDDRVAGLQLDVLLQVLPVRDFRVVEDEAPRHAVRPLLGAA